MEEWLPGRLGPVAPPEMDRARGRATSFAPSFTPGAANSLEASSPERLASFPFRRGIIQGTFSKETAHPPCGSSVRFRARCRARFGHTVFATSLKVRTEPKKIPKTDRLADFTHNLKENVEIRGGRQSGGEMS